MKIVVTGHKGMLGTVLFRELQANGHQCLGLDLPEHDLTDRQKTVTVISTFEPVIIYNCAAFTNVDACETNESTAFAVNATLVETLAMAAKRVDCPLVHISTDYVFNGQAIAPYLPDQPVDPISAYGRTKAAGEQLLQKSGANYFIVRTAWLYGHNGKNFVETIIKTATEKGAAKVVNDQTGAPTFVDDLVVFLLKLVDSTAYGVYHFTNTGITTWYFFAKEFLEILKIPVKLSPCTTDEFPRPSRRPAYSALDLAKTTKTFGITIPAWQDGLRRYLKGRK